MRLRRHLCFVRSQPRPLLFPQFTRRNLGELVGPRFSNQHGDFIVSRPAAPLLNEHFNRLIALTAALAELFEQLRRDASDLEPDIPAPCITLVLDFVAQRADLASEGIAIHLG